MLIAFKMHDIFGILHWEGSIKWFGLCLSCNYDRWTGSTAWFFLLFLQISITFELFVILVVKFHLRNVFVRENIFFLNWWIVIDKFDRMSWIGMPSASNPIRFVRVWENAISHRISLALRARISWHMDFSSTFDRSYTTHTLILFAFKRRTWQRYPAHLWLKRKIMTYFQFAKWALFSSLHCSTGLFICGALQTHTHTKPCT